MTNQQIIEILRDHLGDLEKRERERAARYIELNPTDSRRRSALEDAYRSAILDVSSALSQLNRRIKEERTV